MSVGDVPGTVTICKGQVLFMRVDDAGVLVRNSYFGHARRISWSEISQFTDGRYTKEGVTSWMLVIVLHTGKQVPVLCSVLEPTGKVVAAVREAAQPHGIPADLAGVPMKNGRPSRRALYKDPGGQPGLRFWDGSQWSPLLPTDVSRWSSRAVGESPDSWLLLPTAEGRWPYVESQARRSTVLFTALAAVSAALVIGGLVILLWWDHGTHHKHIDSRWFWFLAVVAAPTLWSAWWNRRLFLKLDEAAKGTRGDGD